MNLINRLKDKWKVGWVQFILIFMTFALGGSLCAKAGSWLLSHFLTEKSVLYWIVYVPLVTVLWPICVLAVSVVFGQYRFFINYLRKMSERMGMRSKNE